MWFRFICSIRSVSTVCIRSTEKPRWNCRCQRKFSAFSARHFLHFSDDLDPFGWYNNIKWCNIIQLIPVSSVSDILLLFVLHAYKLTNRKKRENKFKLSQIEICILMPTSKHLGFHLVQHLRLMSNNSHNFIALLSSPRWKPNNRLIMNHSVEQPSYSKFK